MSDQFERLRKPFPAHELEFRAGSTNGDKTRAMALAYITSRAVMNRLDDVFGPTNWRDEYKEGPDGGVICGISVRTEDGWVTKWDGAENTNFEGVKGGLSDAFKRAAVKWGIARYLYYLDSAWVPCRQRGKTVVLESTPQLPEWALPGGSGMPENPGGPTTRKAPASPNGQTGNKGQNGRKKGGRGKAKRPMKAEDARRAIAMKVAAIGEYNASDEFRGFVRGMLGTLFGGQPNTDEKVHSLIAYVTNMTRDGEFVTSSKDLTGPEIKALRDWISPEEDDEGKMVPSGYAFTEGMHMLRARLEEMGQEALL